jgi:spermidine/putrescine transport system substrate-binding protein
MNKHLNFLYKSVSKLVISLFFVVVVAFCLYAPRIYNYFYKDDKEISIYTFMDVISPKIFKEFEKETGIRVRVSYIENNEELFAKFKISRGEGYDLITPSDFMVELLKKQNLLQKINVEKLSNFGNIDKRLLGHYFDSQNEYSVPSAWAPYGIGFNKKVIPSVVSWMNAFYQDSEIVKKWGSSYKICMSDDAGEATIISSIYLFGKIRNLTKLQLKEIEQLLIQQKKHVERYTISSLKYFLYSDIVPLVITLSAAMKGVMDQSDEFDFIIPKKGSIVTIENLVIPAASKKTDLAHKLIDFILSKKAQLISFDDYGYNPSNRKAYSGIDKKFRKNKSFFPSDKMFKKLHVIPNEPSPKELEKLWLAVKSS